MEEKLKKQLGDMIFMIIALQEQLEQKTKENEELKKKHAKG